MIKIAEKGQNSWDTFVTDYKKIATVNQVVFSKTNPKKQVFLEQKLTLSKVVFVFCEQNHQTVGFI